MSALEAYWRKFVDIKIAEQYFSQYANHSQHRLWIINGLCMVFSFTGVISWITSYLTPFWSATIVLVSQIVSVLQPLYPYSQRLYAAQCIHKEYSNLALSAEQKLNGYLYGDVKDADLLPALESLQNESHDIEGKFCSVTLFPQNMGLHNKAQTDTMRYLTNHFNLEG